MKKIVPTILAAAAALALVPSAAALTTTFPSVGGTWYHGFGPCSTGTCTQSIYVHPKQAHNATAVGKTTIRKAAPAGGVASAFAPKAWTGNQTYYGLGW